MKLDDGVKELIAVGASVAANCQSCLQFHVSKAREKGIDEEKLAAAIAVARAVREGATEKMDRFAASLGGESPAECGAGQGCGCGS